MLNDTLMHWKYTKREKINGKWRYWYDDIKQNIGNKVDDVGEMIVDALMTARSKVVSAIDPHDLAKSKAYTYKLVSDIQRITFEVVDKGADFIEEKLGIVSSGSISGTGLNKKTSILTADEDMALCNPNYPDPLYTKNCTSCALAYELRRRGYDVEALPIDDNNRLETLPIKLSAGADFKNERMIMFEDIVGSKHARLMDSKAATRQITEHIFNNNPDGSRGMLDISWEDGDSGHRAVWEIENESVVIRDPQSNRIIDLDDYTSHATRIDYYRTDNLELSDNIRRYVKNHT